MASIADPSKPAPSPEESHTFINRDDPMHLSFLTAALQRHFDRAEAPEDIETAMSTIRHVLNLVNGDHPNRSCLLLSLQFSTFVLQLLHHSQLLFFSIRTGQEQIILVSTNAILPSPQLIQTMMLP